MSSVFSNGNLWNHATFSFEVVERSLDRVSDRGNPIVEKKLVAVTFKMNPLSERPSTADTIAEDVTIENHEGRVVAVDGDKDVVTFPTSIGPQDVGTGILNGRSCRVTVRKVSQSSLNPVLASILGEKVRLAVTYSSVRSAAS